MGKVPRRVSADATKFTMLGKFEEIILRTIAILGEGEAYGSAIRESAEMITGRMVSVGALYATLERLENKYYIEASVVEPLDKNQGRSKRVYRILASGHAAIEHANNVQKKLDKIAPVANSRIVIGGNHVTAK